MNGLCTLERITKSDPTFLWYLNRPNWPLDETYAKWTLTLFKPLRESFYQDLKADDGTFASLLIQFMWDADFPRSRLSEILRA